MKGCDLTVDRKRQIHFMQIRLIPFAAKRWGKEITDVANLMNENDVFQYITDCFEIFHIEGDETVLDDIEGYLHTKGVVYD